MLYSYIPTCETSALGGRLLGLTRLFLECDGDLTVGIYRFWLIPIWYPS